MLTQLRADNYKSLVNLDLVFDQFGVLVGRNGTGKSAVFEVLRGIRNLLGGARIAECFPTSTLTRFESRTEQQFTLRIKMKHGLMDVEFDYEYDLVVAHDKTRGLPLIHSEILSCPSLDHVLYRYADNTVHLHRNDGSEGTKFPFGSSRSFLSEVIARPENGVLVDVRDWIQRIVLVRPDPRQMGWITTVEGELDRTDEVGARYADWLAFLLQENPKPIQQLFSDLNDCLPMFESLGLERLGNLKRVFLEFRTETLNWRIHGTELSDGQKMLVFLYTLARSAREQLVFIDEPDNYIGLSEMQPFLSLVRHIFHEARSQFIAISHHGETIDYLAADSILLFKNENGITRVRDLSEADALGGRTASEYFFDMA